jgi:hypothetical protein
MPGIDYRIADYRLFLTTDDDELGKFQFVYRGADRWRQVKSPDFPGSFASTCGS